MRSNTVKYKDGTYLAVGSRALELYNEARYHKDPTVRKESEKKLKKHMEDLDKEYKESHGLT